MVSKMRKVKRKRVILRKMRMRRIMKVMRTMKRKMMTMMFSKKLQKMKLPHLLLKVSKKLKKERKIKSELSFKMKSCLSICKSFIRFLS